LSLDQQYLFEIVINFLIARIVLSLLIILRWNEGRISLR